MRQKGKDKKKKKKQQESFWEQQVLEFMKKSMKVALDQALDSILKEWK